MKICVVGLGYVGLPLAIQFAQSNVKVVGLDTDEGKVDLIQKGQSYIKHIASGTIARMIETKRLSASNDFEKIKEVDAVIICVPTPFTKNREPDISFILETGRAKALFLKSEIRNPKFEIRESRAPHRNPLPGRSGEGDAPRAKLVVLESTTYPGTTDQDLRDLLEERSSLKAGVDFHLAFSPEREDPANEQSKVKKIPKVVGGYTPAGLERAAAQEEFPSNPIKP